jgi:hypothetical protein
MFLKNEVEIDINKNVYGSKVIYNTTKDFITIGTNKGKIIILKKETLERYYIYGTSDEEEIKSIDVFENWILFNQNKKVNVFDIENKKIIITIAEDLFENTIKVFFLNQLEIIVMEESRIQIISYKKPMFSKNYSIDEIKLIDKTYIDLHVIRFKQKKLILFVKNDDISILQYENKNMELLQKIKFIKSIQDVNISHYEIKYDEENLNKSIGVMAIETNNVLSIYELFNKNKIQINILKRIDLVQKIIKVKWMNERSIMALFENSCIQLIDIYADDICLVAENEFINEEIKYDEEYMSIIKDDKIYKIGLVDMRYVINDYLDQNLNLEIIQLLIKLYKVKQ